MTIDSNTPGIELEACTIPIEARSTPSASARSGSSGEVIENPSVPIAPTEMAMASRSQRDLATPNGCVQVHRELFI